MKPLCYKNNNSSLKFSFVQCLLVLLAYAFISHLVQAEERPATAFYYAKRLPLDLLSTYARVVVEPDNVTTAELTYLKQQGVRVYAYFSLGEVGPERPWLAELQPHWILGINSGWKSSVMDLTQPGWRQYAIEKQLQALKKRGFDAFFLDTLDSYQLFAKTSEAQQQQQQGLILLIKGIKQQLGNVHLLFNRGFEILGHVAPLCDGVVAESLFKGWDPGKATYKEVTEQDRTWLINKLQDIRARYHLPVTVLDYLPPKDRDEAEKIAQKIKALGFIPWISTPALDYMGVGELNLLPRKILLLYDSAENKLAFSNVHRFLAMPVEYLGYVPEYIDIRDELPDMILKGRVAGIVAWTSAGNIGKQANYEAWVLKQLQDNVKVAFMNTFPFVEAENIKKALNLEVSTTILPEPFELDIQSAQVGYEIAPLKRRLDLLTLKSNVASNIWIRVKGAPASAVSEPVFTADWGGMALSPYLYIETDHNDITGETLARWIIDPFAFLQEALQLPELPVADSTTENGRRILTTHIDGDGFYNKTEVNQGQYSPELIMQSFIVPSGLPHTVSVIEGEISAHGLKSGSSQLLENLARQLFKLPNVEIASHSYSHPFYWSKAAEFVRLHPENANHYKELRVDSEKRYTLPIPDYQYSAQREVEGSVRYINEQLAPVHKKTKVFLWTGDGLPDEDAIAWADQLQLANMNGGGTVTRNGQLSLTNISPSGIVQGTHFQPYAPVQNENSYTNNWTGPFYGYQEVINTFKLTDAPKRLKPIALYYHFYIGDKNASVASLKRVYTWAQGQQTLPLWISEYTPRLYGFREAVYEKLANGWKIYHAQNLKTLRLASNAEPPHPSTSTGIAGYKVLPQGLYVSLTGQDVIHLTVTKNNVDFPYLDNSNAQIVAWQKQNNHLNFRLQGHQKVTFAFAHFHEYCHLKNAAHQAVSGTIKNSLRIFSFNSNDTGLLELTCE